MSTITPPLHPGDIVERDFYDHAGRPPRVERFTVAAVHHLDSEDPRKAGSWASALTPDQAATGWPSGEASLIRGNMYVSSWDLMPHAGLWFHADELRLVEHAPLDLLQLLAEAAA